MLSRLAAGVVAGYALASSSAVWLSYVLPMQRADAVATGILVSFIVYAAAIIYAFAAHSHTRIWCGLIGLTLVFMVFAVLLRPEGATW